MGYDVGKSKPKPSKNGHATEPTEPAEPAEPPKACYVLSLEIENVRCFGPKQTLDLSDGHGRPAQWTIILGENGVGKTTLLRVIASLLSEQWFGTRNWDPSGPLGIHPVKYPSFELLPAARLVAEGDVVRIAVSFTTQENLTARPVEVESRSISIRNGEVNVEPLRKLIPCYGYGASRRFSQAPPDGKGNDSGCSTLFDEPSQLRSTEDWLIQLDYTSSKNWNVSATAARRRDLAKELLIGVLPDVTDIQFIPGEGMYPRASVVFQTPYGWVPLHRLGYGFQTVIAWMTDLVSRMTERYPDSPDSLKEPAIVVVDEIDLHLHPTWQRKLIAFLTERFPNTQFIATAHSPLVVQAAANANLAVLRREGDHVVIDNDVDEIRGWRVDQILTSDLFGLKSSRSPEFENLFERKQQLLAKTKLTTKEKAELAQVNAAIEELPTGATAQDVKDMALLRKVLDTLKTQSPP